MKNKKIQTLITGLALFSMFFGSGNLIFPLFVGKESGTDYFWSVLGFNCTGALLPFLGIITMVIFAGDYERFFGYFSKKLGFIFILFMLTFWIPLGSGPRCITLSYAALQQTLGQDIPLWAFSILYSAIVYALTIKQSRILGILGSVLTPALLISLGVILFKGLFLAEEFSLAPSVPAFWLGLREGYYTMDLVAAFFFSATIIGLLRNGGDSSGDERSVLRQALHSGFVGATILILVYLGLIVVSAKYSAVLSGTPKDALLPVLAVRILGTAWGKFASVAVGFACLTTSIALASVFSDFLRVQILRNRVSHGKALLITTLVTYYMSIQGFEIISKVSSPFFDIAYPILVVMMLVIVPLELWKRSKLSSKARLQTVP